MKRMFLALTFVAALGAAGLGISNTAEARHGCGRSYGYSTFYPAYYSYYGPRVAYYRGVDFPYRYYGHHHHDHYYHDRGGISFTIGF